MGGSFSEQEVTGDTAEVGTFYLKHFLNILNFITEPLLTRNMLYL